MDHVLVDVEAGTLADADATHRAPGSCATCRRIQCGWGAAAIDRVVYATSAGLRLDLIDRVGLAGVNGRGRAEGFGCLDPACGHVYSYDFRPHG